MEDKGFFGALFALSFSEFVTIKLVRILYILMLIVIAIGLLVGIIVGFITMFTDSFFGGLGAIVGVLLGSLIWVIMSRVWMEIIIVVFRIAENTTDLVQMKRQQ